MNQNIEILFGSKLLRPEQVVKLPPMPGCTDWLFPVATAPAASIDYGSVVQCALLGAILGAMVGR